MIHIIPRPLPPMQLPEPPHPVRLDATGGMAEGAQRPFSLPDTTMSPIRRATVLALFLLLGGCASTGSHWVELAGTRYRVELAQDDATRARGLMFRDRMEANHGMLFIHDLQEPQAYWMKNTRIPLDILYFDDARRLVSQQRDVPPCSAGDACPPYPSFKPALYVLELNAGQAARLQLQEGAVLTFGPGISGNDTPHE